jgi:ribose-phosphate pyrophosphokinase
MLIFSTPEYSYLKESVAARFGVKPAEMEFKLFPDGEEYIRFIDDVSGQDVVLIAGAVSANASSQLYDMASALSDLGARMVHVFIPYLSYSTMERRTRSGESIRLKYHIRTLDSLPSNCKMYMLDLHSHDSTVSMFKKHQVQNLTCFNQVTSIIKETAPDAVIASPDQGRSKFIDNLGCYLGLPTAHIIKERIDGSTVELVGIQAHVQGKTVVIYDDMIRSGATLIQAAKAYRDAGATKVYAIATHWVIGNSVAKRLAEANVFTRVFVSNSNPKACEISGYDFISVFDAGEVIYLELNKVFHGRKTK